MSDRATFPVAGAVCATNRIPRGDRSTQYIDHSSDVAASISNLYGNELFSDVTLVVQGVQFTAHKVVLAARSEYFRALLYGGLAESNRSVIQLNDINAAAFKHVLQYIYTGRLTVTKLRTMLDVLGLAHQYDFRSLETALSAHLTHSLRLSNVWLIYNLAVMYGLEELINACLKFLDGIAPAPLFSPHFLHLSQPAVERLLSRDSFCASEIDIFRSLCAWFRTTKESSTRSGLYLPPITDQNQDSVCKSGISSETGSETLALVREKSGSTDVKMSIDSSVQPDKRCMDEPPWNHALSESEWERQVMRRCVRFELMSLRDLLSEVRASKMVSPDDLLDAISLQAKTMDELPHRGWSLPGINLASPRFAASLVAGEEGSYPYFFVDDADDADDLAELQFTLGALEAGGSDWNVVDMDNVDEDVDETSESDSRSDLNVGSVSRSGDGDVPVGSLGSHAVPAPQGEASSVPNELTESGDRDDPSQQERLSRLPQNVGGGTRSIQGASASRPPNQFASPDWIQTQSNLSGARLADFNQYRSLGTDYQHLFINHQGCLVPRAGSSSAAQQNASSAAVAIPSVHGLQHHMPAERSVRWLQPSNPRTGRRIAPHPPPPPHSEHDVVRHSLDDPDAHIVIRLGKPSIVNTIRMQLWDREVRCYSYYVEVSLDQVTWHRVVDYRTYLCRSWQTLHFPTRVVHYFRITGTRNTSNRTFHLITFRCLYTDHVCRQVDGFLVPTYNVASVDQGATVLEGVSRNRNALIDGNARMYDWNSGYTCHQLGNGAIVVQLSQPYLIRSMRFLLWDLDDRTYSYSVHVSTNREDWRLVRDATRDRCQSWQIITFPPQLVTFIRVVGSHNTANEVFHLVHLECPYPPAELMEEQEQFSKINTLAITNTQSLNLNPEPAGASASLVTSGSEPSEPNSTSENPSYQATQATELLDSASVLDPITDLAFAGELETRTHSPPTPLDPPDETVETAATIPATRSLTQLPIDSSLGAGMESGRDMLLDSGAAMSATNLSLNRASSHDLSGLPGHPSASGFRGRNRLVTQTPSPRNNAVPSSRN
ncbi:hypothetical protein CRM22_000993 [Opisthorchis felineus]|uniref:BTB domain-containing protein n=1 Tax=Opisthorchis felineus TaxID=147828 RepID=A0A4S2MCK5_OPIFE|nr:hypothetical protein CRM22_000993 [Opisthorchis felineus]